MEECRDENPLLQSMTEPSPANVVSADADDAKRGGETFVQNEAALEGLFLQGPFARL